MTTIANQLAPEKLAQLMESVGLADVPADLAIPAELINAPCEFCGEDLQVAVPVLGTIACVDCAKAKTTGRAGRRYTKVHYPARTQVRPEELARAARIDYSHLSDGEFGQLVRRQAVAMTVTRMQDRPAVPDLTADQSRKVAVLMEAASLDRARAVAIVLRVTVPKDHDCDYYRASGGICTYCDGEG
jgi:hypothetical protein